MKLPKQDRRRYLLTAMTIYITLTAPIVLLFATNWMFRYHFFNIMAHYRSKITRPYTLHAGDSITAGGGHWSLLLGRTPFDSITLAENGYTVKQITSKVILAKQYNPKTISIMAGTNDVFHPRYRLDETLLDFKEMLDAAQDVSDSCIVTLPPLTRIPSASESIAELNSQIKPLIQNSKCRIIDLNPFLAPNGILLDQYTTDGVHLSPKAYDEWARQLKAVLN